MIIQNIIQIILNSHPSEVTMIGKQSGKNKCRKQSIENIIIKEKKYYNDN